MDIMFLSEMLAKLVPDNESVGLPGLGSFVVESAPAAFSDRGYTINPPYRRLSFVPGAPTDDTLAELFASSCGVTADEARRTLETYSLQIKEVLSSRNCIVMPGLGKLRSTRTGTIFFVPNESLDIWPEGIGLESVSLKTHAETPEEVARAVSELSSLIAAAPVPSEPEPEPVAAPEPEPEPEPAPDPAPVAAPEPAPAPAPEAAPAPEPLKPGRRGKWWVWPAAVLGVCALAFAAFFALSRLAPDFTDSLLYTPEELRIINEFNR